MENLLSKITASLDLGMVEDFGDLFSAVLTLVGIILLVMGLSYIAKFIIFKLYVKCTNKNIQEAVTKVIYYLDSLCDKLSKKEKRKEAIRSVKDLFIWRNIPIPDFVIGVIIDLEVAAIRKLQKECAEDKDPYLHPDDETSETQDEEVTTNEMEITTEEVGEQK